MRPRASSIADSPSSASITSNPDARSQTGPSDGEWGFNSTAGVEAAGSTKGFPVRDEEATGAETGEYNTTAGAPSSAADAPDYRIALLDLAGDELLEIKKIIDAGSYRSGEGRVAQRAIKPEYLDRLQTAAKLTRPFRVVVDTGNGVAGLFAPELLR